MSDVTGAARDMDGWVTDTELLRLEAAGVIRAARWARGEKLARMDAHAEHRAAVMAEHRHGCPVCAIGPEWVLVGERQTENGERVT